MNKLKEYKIVFIIAGSVLTATLALFVFVIVPTYSTVTETAAAIHDNRVQLEILRLERENIEQTQKEYSAIRENIEELDKIFVAPDDVLGVISALENVAAENNITQELALLSEPTKSMIGMKLTISCPWNQCLEYLSLLEQLDIYLTLTDPSVIRAGDKVTFTFNAAAHTNE